MKHSSNFRKGYTFIFLSLLSTTIFSLTADFLFRENPTVNPANMLFWSIAWALILATPFFFWFSTQRRKVRKLLAQDFDKILLIGAISFVGATLWNYALKASSAGILTLMSKTTFLLTVFLGVAFLDEKINKKESGALLVVILGLACIANLKWEVTFIALVYTFLSSCCYAILSLLIKRLWKEADMKSVAYLRALCVSIFLFIFLYITGQLVIPPRQILIFWPLSEIFGIILWAVFYFEAHRFLPISKLNVFGIIEVAIVPIWAFLVFGDAISLQKILWAVLIFAGIAWFFHEQVQEQFKS